MKRFNKYVLAALIILAAAILSCKPAIFKGITIKAKPELRLNLGSKDFSFEEFISEKKISEMAGNDPLLKNLFRYKKDANDNELKFMFHYPVTDLNFNMKTNLEDNLKQFKEGLSKTLENKEFTIPEINKTQSYEVDLSPIKEKLNKISEFVTFPSFEKSIPEGDVPSTEISFDLPLGDKFTTLKFKEGAKFNIAITTTDASPDFKVNITNINLLTQEESTTISSWTGTSTAADLDIGGDKTLYNNMKLKLTIQTSGGDPAHSGTKLKVTTKITGEIKEATGLKLGEITRDIPEQTLPVGGDFQEAEIETGSINITKSPDFSKYGWENIGLNFNINAKQDGGLAEQDGGINKALTVGDNNLNGTRINNNPIKIKGKVKFTINNATYKDVEQPKLNLEFAFNIAKFNYIKVKMPDSFNPSYTYEQPIPETLKEWVREIDISALKIDLTMDNQLPPDNNIGVTISSTAFGLSESTVTFPAVGKNTETIQKNGFTFEPAAVTSGKIDMKTKITFPGGYDQANKILTIKNVAPGQKISMGGELKLTIDWNSAKITPKTSNTLKGTFPKEGATDLSKIKEFTKGNMKFKDVNLYIYANSEILKGKTNKIKGKIYAEYTEEGASHSKYILGSDASDDTGLSDIQFKEQLPDSFYNRDKTKPYTGELPTASITQDISEILNAAPNDLKIKYEIKLEEITIKPNDLTNTSNQKMNLDLLLEIPLKINFDKDTDILTITDNDSLSSISQAQGDPVNEVMNAVRNIKMHIEYENRTGLQLAAKVIFKNKGGTNILEKELKMLNGNNNLTLEINAEEAEKLKKQENLLTEFKIMLPKGDYTLTNGSSLKLKAHISSKLDINKEFKIF
ncbi:hypothetical protein E4O05_06300 [Treponema sp. OMZ 787]|uniref:hypothetical protein n=1 Tax=Treponema sp. OMZ 787 TaxID=2563669 RepID=UPI0020A52EA6|nr:hypothetical protein [Treponema sp. OMZ 787]UTC63491.1 hypothetical protein E4O05_06300 [Treponema sp. OMZ 787]